MREHSSSPATAGIASSLIPGSGQLMTGAKTAGAILLVTTCMTAAVVGYAASGLDRIRLLEYLTNPVAILVLVVINLVFGLIRMVAATDAWRRAGGRAFGFGILILLIFTATPHIAIGYVGLETRSTLLAVFSAPPPRVIAAAPTTTSIATTTTIDATTSPVPEREIPIEPTTTTSTTTTIPLGVERVTFLLLGGDAGPGRSGLRTDSMMVATINTISGDAAIFGLPRNMAGFKFSDGSDFPGLGQGILNEVYMWGQRNPERFPGTDPGVAAISDVAQTLLGLPIDHYVLVDMIGFARLVDVIGGVDINVSKAMAAPLYDRSSGGHETIQFTPGWQHLDGDRALAYSRSRTASNDYKRMARQRCVISALVDQAGPLTLMTRLPALLDVLETSISTDIPINDLPYLINLAPVVSSDRTTAIGFDLDYRSGQFTAGGLAKPDVEKIQTAVQEIISDDWDSGSFALDTAASSCG